MSYRQQKNLISFDFRLVFPIFDFYFLELLFFFLSLFHSAFGLRLFDPLFRFSISAFYLSVFCFFQHLLSDPPFFHGFPPVCFIWYLWYFFPSEFSSQLSLTFIVPLSVLYFQSAFRLSFF